MSAPKPAAPRQRLVWPVPALVAWSAAWATFLLLAQVGVSAWIAVAVASGIGIAFIRLGATRCRRILIGTGFPASLVAGALALALPAWSWLVPLALLLLIYPLHAWRDAPVFPTPNGALAGIGRAAPLRPGARVLDAGCGLGDGLAELHREYPQALIGGIEWSWLLARICAWRCRFAQVRRADLWAGDWSEFEFVYVFQRPESMARAAAKAAGEMRRGAWLASLEFEVHGLVPEACLQAAGGKPVWLYRTPFKRR